MTVAELIEKLKAMPQDLPVVYEERNEWLGIENVRPMWLSFETVRPMTLAASKLDKDLSPPQSQQAVAVIELSRD